ncbi:MAG: hypothetical protein ACK4S4_11545 [Pyrinomonadaceae bacterium]
MKLNLIDLSLVAAAAASILLTPPAAAQKRTAERPMQTAFSVRADVRPPEMQ